MPKATKPRGPGRPKTLPSPRNQSVQLSRAELAELDHLRDIFAERVRHISASPRPGRADLIVHLVQRELLAQVAGK